MHLPVTLTITHPTLSADAISRLLQMDGHVKHTVGETRRALLPGQCLYEKWDHTFWSHVFLVKLPEGTVTVIKDKRPNESSQ
jgi:hypothetical protein